MQNRVAFPHSNRLRTPIFIGYDPREAVNFHVCVNSILRHAREPVSIIPLYLPQLPYRESHGDGSNQFIYSRFLVPYLCGFNGWALYMDSDMIVKSDVCELFDLKNDWCDAMVVKHEYKTKHHSKYLGAKNEDYPRKNWSSLILWNCASYPNRILTSDFVAKQSGKFLHRFEWISDGRLGELGRQWNWLVGEYPHNAEAKILHYTLGSPAFSEYANCDHSTEWNAALAKMMHCEQLMEVA